MSPYLGWTRAIDFNSASTLFPTTISALDIVQGINNDCYYLTATSAIAETPARLQNIFINTVYPAEGMLALNMWIKGKPTVITIDDYLPIYNDNSFFGTGYGANTSAWGAFLEKAYAKIVGNYQFTAGGY